MSNLDYKEWEIIFDEHKNGLRPSSEFDWFGVDAKSQIACFMTAGFELVPLLVYQNKKASWEVYQYFYEAPDDYSIISIDYSLMDYDVSLYSKRGLFSYDNPSEYWKPYELIGSPVQPILITDLPEKIQEYLDLLPFFNLNFSDSPKIEVSDYLQSG